MQCGGLKLQYKNIFWDHGHLLKLSAIEDGDLTPDQVDKIATELSVPHKEVISMNRRISGSDYSLNSPVTDDSSGEWQDWLEDDTQNQEASFADTEEYLIKKNILSDSLEKEKEILYLKGN